MSATRPLSFRWAVTTDKGLRRTSNEDSHCERSDIGLFVVADGMGGHVAGEVASREAVDAIQAFITDTASADKNRTWPFPFEPSLSLEANRLKAAFRLANRKIASAIAEASDLRGMATTASALLAGASTACVAHVGDSRVYRLRTGAARTVDARSLVGRGAGPGGHDERVGRAAAPLAQRGHARAVRGRGSRGRRHRSGARRRAIATCSARTGCSRSSPIRRSPRSSATRGCRCRRSAGALISAANAGGGPDNITALVLEVDAS